jgi:hypothetical protein
MATTNAYATLAELKLELKITDSTDDDKLELALDAASRWIDTACGWRFYTTSSDETRYYTATMSGRLDVLEGIVSLTTLACDQDGDRTYEETWTVTTDYDLTPHNANTDGQPYTAIETSPLSRYGFSKWRKGVKLVGKFGYAATAPRAIKRATVLKAQQLFMRKDMPFGVMGASAVGTITMSVPVDADILALIRPYIRSID